MYGGIDAPGIAAINSTLESGNVITNTPRRVLALIYIRRAFGARVC